MELSEYKTLYQTEANHFYYQANHQIILNFIKNYYLKKLNGLKILDAGCGTGLFAKKLSKFGAVIGLDISRQAVNFSQRRGVDTRLGSICKLPFKKNSFDLVTSVDVLYHLGIDDQKAIDETYRVLKRGGILIIRVPAYDWLRRSCDVSVHTRHRYNSRELKLKLEKSGFLVLKISYLNLLLLPFSLVSYILEKFTGQGSPHLINLPPPVNTFVTKMLSFEEILLQYINIPVGLGILAICKKN